MDLKDNEKIKLQIKKGDEIVYQYEFGLLEFQKELMKNENVSFFYLFKDSFNELDDMILEKIKCNSKNIKNTFNIEYLDKSIYSNELSSDFIDSEIVKTNEMEIYFLLEKFSKKIIRNIDEEHKKIIMSNL